MDKQTGQRKVAANVVDDEVKWKAIEAARSTQRRVNGQAETIPGCAR